MILRASFWADASRGGPDIKKFREKLCPAGHDVIPPFSLLEVELVCRVRCCFIGVKQHVHVFLRA